jgi:thiamine biosynthesis lipoprotein
MKKLALCVLLVVFIILLAGCIAKGITFELSGELNVFMQTGDTYVEAGFIAKDGSKDLSDYVTVSGFVDTSYSGDYQITYTLDYDGNEQTLTRNIYVREPGCSPIIDTNITACESYWSAYLHTSIKLTIYYEGTEYHDTVHNIFDRVEEILKDYHRLSTKYDDYGIENIYAINQTPSLTHILDYRLFDMIRFSLDRQNEVNQYFNIALGPVLEIWHDHRESCNRLVDSICDLPSEAELVMANKFTDPANIILNQSNNSITMQPGMKLDLGGISKGYISGKIIEYLNSLNISYLLNNGTSNISIGGVHPTRENGKFLLAITDPSNPQNWYAEVYLSDGDQLVTSGDYQQYFIVDGNLYHHIINPNTLFPERYSRSVSLIMKNPALADLYSTAIFNMTIDEGLAFVNSHEDLEAIWYSLDGKAIMSDNFDDLYLNKLYIPNE